MEPYNNHSQINIILKNASNRGAFAPLIAVVSSSLQSLTLPGLADADAQLTLSTLACLKSLRYLQIQSALFTNHDEKTACLTEAEVLNVVNQLHNLRTLHIIGLSFWQNPTVGFLSTLQQLTLEECGLQNDPTLDAPCLRSLTLSRCFFSSPYSVFNFLARVRSHIEGLDMEILFGDFSGTWPSMCFRDFSQLQSLKINAQFTKLKCLDPLPPRLRQLYVCNPRVTPSELSCLIKNSDNFQELFVKLTVRWSATREPPLDWSESTCQTLLVSQRSQPYIYHVLVTETFYRMFAREKGWFGITLTPVQTLGQSQL